MHSSIVHHRLRLVELQTAIEIWMVHLGLYSPTSPHHLVWNGESTPIVFDELEQEVPQLLLALAQEQFAKITRSRYCLLHYSAIRFYTCYVQCVRQFHALMHVTN